MYPLYCNYSFRSPSSQYQFISDPKSYLHAQFIVIIHNPLTRSTNDYSVNNRIPVNPSFLSHLSRGYVLSPASFLHVKTYYLNAPLHEHHLMPMNLASKYYYLIVNQIQHSIQFERKRYCCASRHLQKIKIIVCASRSFI